MSHEYNPASPGGIITPDVCAHCNEAGLTTYVHVAGIGQLCRKCKKEFEGIEVQPPAKGKRR